jgi:phosphatidylserine/phosphatidylglycerophosphate/cardiolipin synthase-like enzyme
MLAIINNAQKTLLVENEEMSASNIVSALDTACTRGVTVHIAMEYSSDYVSNFNSLKAAGCKLSTYNNPNGFYIHAKAVVADYGLGTQNAYMGSINYSSASMTQNRELGMFVSDPVSVQLLNTTIASDYLGLGQTYPF